MIKITKSIVICIFLYYNSKHNKRRKYNMGKKTILVALPLAFALFAAPITVEAATIKGQILRFGNEGSRQFIRKSGVRVALTGGGVTKMNGIKVNLVNAATGEVVKTVISNSPNSEDDNIIFNDVEDGTYYVQLDETSISELKVDVVTAVDESGYWEMATKSKTYTVMNDQLLDETGTPVDRINYLVTNHPVATIFETERGHFAIKGSNNKIEYVKKVQPYSGGLITINKHGTNYIRLLGPQIDDSLGNIPKIIIPTPIISDEETAAGIQFVGWQTDESMAEDYDLEKPVVLTPRELNSLTIKGDMHLKAVFNVPAYTIKFKTDQTKGEIEGNVEKNYSVEALDYIKEIPTPTPKKGYEFVGWFEDLSTNTVTEADMKKDKVVKGRTYFAKYREIKEPTPPMSSTIKKGNVRVTYKTTSGEILESKVIIEEQPVGTTYKTVAKKIDGYELKTIPDNATGKITAGEIEVIYVYEEVTTPPVVETGTVKVIYKTDDNEMLEIASVLTNQPVGTPYHTTKKEFNGYTLTKEPDNKDGEVTKGTTEVVYVYKKNVEPIRPETPAVKTGNVNVIHKTTDGEILGGKVITDQPVGATYTTTSEKFDGYVLKETPDNAKGLVVEGEIDVVYTYEKAAVSEKPKQPTNPESTKPAEPAVSKPSAPATKKAQLPRTGSESASMVFGTAVLSMLAGLGLVGTRKQTEE